MRLILLPLTLIAMFDTPAFAHPGPDHTHSLTSGILHPLTGADHVFAMASVGLWAAFVGGRAIWAWPATFITVMLAGFCAARLGLQISFVESAISASILILGVLAAAGVRVPIAVGAAVVGLLFGFFHGHAHGTEATGASVLPYAAGFTFSTAVLHGAGIGLGLSIRSLIERLSVTPMRGLRSAVGGDEGLR
jgi:urease accessory protein